MGRPLTRTLFLRAVVLLRRARRRLFPDLRELTGDETTQLLFVGAIVGALAGLAAGGLDRLIAETSKLVLGTTEPSLGGVPWWMALGGPVLGGVVAAVLLHLGTRTRRPAGIPDVIDATWNHKGYLSLRTGVFSGLAAAAAVGGGQSGGREGPIAQLSAAVASHVGRRLHLPPRRLRVMVAAGAAAGIAASFNTPIGAAFFAMEVVLGNFAMEMFGPVVAATVTGTLVGQALLGDRVALVLPAYSHSHPAELVLFGILGAACGAIAVGFKKAIVWGQTRAEGLPVPAWARPALAGVVVGLVGAVGMPQVMGNGYAFMEALLRGEASVGVGVLVLIVAAKLVTAIITQVGRGGPGLFAPALFLGCATGIAFGQAAEILFPTLGVQPGIYGVVAMGAVAAAVTHAPVTMALMLFEMTRNYQVVLPLLMTLAVAGLVAATLGSDSVYLTALKAAGVRVDRTREELVMHHLAVGDLMQTDDLPVVPCDLPPDELVARFLARRNDELFVVGAGGRFAGIIDIQDAKRLMAGQVDSGTLGEVVRTGVPTLRATDTLADALPRFFEADLDELPVIDDEGRLVGTLRERYVLGAYSREVLRKDALLARVESEDSAGRHTDWFELPPGQVLRGLAVTAALQGQTLRSLALPRRFGVTVLAVITHDARGREHRLPADANRPLQAGDRIVVLGPEAQMEDLVRDREDDATEELGREG